MGLKTTCRFPGGTKEEVIQRNVEFLQKYGPTGHVPRYKQIHSVEFGLIKMEFVDGITLSEFVKTDQAKGFFAVCCFLRVI